MKVVRRKFSLIELLAAITIISILAGTIYVVFGSQTKNAEESHARAVLNGIKVAMSSYNNAYGKPPSALKNMLKENNARGMGFFDGNRIPRDPFSLTKGDIQIVPHVSAVEYDKDDNIIAVTDDGNGFVLFSVGPNHLSDGGTNDGAEKDDISIYVDF